MAVRSSALVLVGGLLLLLVSSSSAQLPIPARYDGFNFNRPSTHSPILLEAFLDPLCPYSRDSWPAVKKVAQDAGEEVLLIVHPFPLPYHHNAFFASRALHIMNAINSSLTFPLLELFFEYQNNFSLEETTKETSNAVLKEIATLASYRLNARQLESLIYSGFQNPSTDTAARTSFKYGCSRAVPGTPFFFLNGIPLYDAGSSWDYFKWRSIIDPLVNLTNKWELVISYKKTSCLSIPSTKNNFTQLLLAAD